MSQEKTLQVKVLHYIPDDYDPKIKLQYNIHPLDGLKRANFMCGCSLTDSSHNDMGFILDVDLCENHNKRFQAEKTIPFLHVSEETLYE